MSFFYPQIISKEVFSLTKFGTINIHPAKLPEYRGAHVMNWMLINGETEGNCTFHKMEQGIDAGEVLHSVKYDIDIEDTINDVKRKNIQISISNLAKVIHEILEGKIKSTPQEEGDFRYYRRRSKEDGLINWSENSLDIYNKVRALCHPWPGAYFYIENHRVRINKCRVRNKSHVPPGSIFNLTESSFLISCGDYSIEPLEFLIKDDSLTPKELIKNYNVLPGLIHD